MQYRSGIGYQYDGQRDIYSACNWIAIDRAG